VNETVLPLATDAVAIHVSGHPRLHGWILRLEHQVYVAFAGAIVITWLCLYAYFRDWRGALRPTISGGLAALWGFGLIRLTGFALNPLTLLIPFLITARAVSHSAQMHDRYYEELEAGEAKASAVNRSFARLVAPTLAGIVTDAFGLLAIAIVAIPALQALAVAAVARSLARAGRTVAFTALTMTAGVLCFAWTDIRFVGEMAALLALWMLTSAVSALVVVPAILLALRPRFLAAHPGRTAEAA